ncbi:MAG: AraC family transcriptional regulator [Deltaproteobacteria bacterium]|jgi:AraC-like DNA-binding protein|nr:AraC family transcriptional regulator [Deltaproteobacteria bacterium]MBT6433294.1 AraC family transcriptional regulator [Deltaproteobacteria bacterium]MBT6489547.1 AraC family transcriptional regulator [Deltaproteobacteria bacterium]
MIEGVKKIVVAGLYARRVIDTAGEMSVTVAQLADAINLDSALLENLPDQFPGDSYVKLINAAAKLSGDADFGLHVGERISPASYPVLGYTLMSCNTLSHALAQVTRYEEIIHNLGHFKLDIDSDTMELSWANALEDADSNRHVTESVLAGLRIFAERLVERSIPIHSVSLIHAAPENTDELKRIFGDNITFNASINTVICSNEILGWPVAQADASLFPVLQQHAERLLTLRSEAPSVVDDVRRALSSLLSSGDVKLKHVAENLEIHPRTLQRRLSEADTSFAHVLEELRQDMAEHYLGDSSVSLGEVAFLLGYHDQSSFNRAFKEWKGQNPSNYRSSLPQS